MLREANVVELANITFREVDYVSSQSPSARYAEKHYC